MDENQAIEIKIRQMRLGIESKKIAKELNRTVSAISKAYSGECPTVLHRIDRYLTRMERLHREKSMSKNSGQPIVPRSSASLLTAEKTTA